MKRSKFDELIRDYQEGRLSGTLQETMDAWFDSLQGPAHGYWTGADIERLKLELDRRRQQQENVIRIRRLLRYAAVLVGALVIGFLFWKQEPTTIEPTTVERERAASTIFPGDGKATLTLTDGTVVDLRADQTGIVVGENLTYADGSDIVISPAETAEYVLSTPKGGTYQVTLPDGSQVWLNAASTLTYPARFRGNERLVEIEGEGYFDVVEDHRRPFKVLSKGQAVAVLGTQFNISSYPEEAVSKTTLVTGKVQIVNLASNVAHHLNPGEQSTIHGSSTDINKVDPSVFTAWKDGFFYFDRLSTTAAIAQLARWYDLDVAYQGKLVDLNIFAYIERNKPLDGVLKSLEKSGLRFKLVQSGDRTQLVVLGEQ